MLLNCTSTDRSAEEMYPILVPIAGKWQQLAKKMGLDKKYIKSVLTANDTDYLCLHHLLKDNCRFHTWNRIRDALLDIGETDIAERCGSF